MSYDLLALQEAVQAKLAGSSAVQALLGSPVRLYDHAPPSTAYPFVLYGDQRALAFDTKDTTGLEVTLSLTAYSRGRGRRELRQVESALYAALHRQSFTVTGANFCQCLFIRSQQSLEDDGLTYRATLDFRLTITD